jgi:hypothetical protein
MKRFENEAQSVFLDEIYSKKKETASLRTAQKHKRLGKGNMMFPSDFMNRKEKIQHRKAGEVMTTNMYDTILPFAEFNELQTYEKKNRMQHWRLNNTIKVIQAEMGIPNQKYYDILRELELPLDRTAKSGKPRKPRTSKTVAVITKTEAVAEKVAQQEKIITPIQEVILNGLNLSFNGTYDAELIQKQLLKILTLLDGEEGKYYVEMKLMQK